MEDIWENILLLKKEVGAYSEPIEICWLSLAKKEVLINQEPTNKSQFIKIFCNGQKYSKSETNQTFQLTENGNVLPLITQKLPTQTELFLKKYLPYCFLALKAKKQKRAICITHFAQTLDAKIATNSGDSKWIGNKENLIHAHRMRALCESVLIGSRTVENDQPRLNVRHVKGEDPIRIVVGHPKSSFKSLIDSSKQKILVFGKKNIVLAPPLYSVQLPCYENNIINPKTILEKLFQLGIHSVYLEGGANTTSLFLKSSAVDILQLHLAPLIFGSGKTSIVLPSISEVQEAINFKEYHFLPFGDSVMFTGFLG